MRNILAALILLAAAAPAMACEYTPPPDKLAPVTVKFIVNTARDDRGYVRIMAAGRVLDAPGPALEGTAHQPVDRLYQRRAGHPGPRLRPRL